MKHLGIILLFLGLSLVGFGQTPSWSVDPSQYQYTANLTAILVKGNDTLKESGNKLAAFLGAEVRGVADPISFNGNQLYFLTIYSNNPNGEMLHFKIYLGAEDSVYESADTLTFVSNNITGSPSSPEVLHLSVAPSSMPAFASCLNKGLVFPNPINSNSVLSFEWKQNQLCEFTLLDNSGRVLSRSALPVCEGVNQYLLSNLFTIGNLNKGSFVVVSNSATFQFYKIN